MANPEKITPNHALVLPIDGANGWAGNYYANQYITDWVQTAANSNYRLISGTFDDQNIIDVQLKNSVDDSILTFPNVSYTESDTRKVYYCEIATTTIKVIELPNNNIFDNDFDWPIVSGDFPLLHVGKFNSTALTKQSFYKWIAPETKQLNKEINNLKSIITELKTDLEKKVLANTDLTNVNAGEIEKIYNILSKMNTQSGELKILLNSQLILPSGWYELNGQNLPRANHPNLIRWSPFHIGISPNRQGDGKTLAIRTIQKTNDVCKAIIDLDVIKEHGKNSIEELLSLYSGERNIYVSGANEADHINYFGSVRVIGPNAIEYKTPNTISNLTATGSLFLSIGTTFGLPNAISRYLRHAQNGQPSAGEVLAQALAEHQHHASPIYNTRFNPNPIVPPLLPSGATRRETSMNKFKDDVVRVLGNFGQGYVGHHWHSEKIYLASAHGTHYNTQNFVAGYYHKRFTRSDFGHINNVSYSPLEQFDTWTTSSPVGNVKNFDVGEIRPKTLQVKFIIKG